MIALLFALNMSYGYFVEMRAKRQITGRFGQYVPPELVEEMSQHPEVFSMDGESRDMSVLFSDVRGFTTISEGLEPKELSKLMNEFLTPLTQVIYRHRGTIDKYMGDCIMAFWGAPMSDSQHYGVSMIVGDSTRAAMPDFAFRELDRVRAKGKKEPVAIYEPLGPTAAVDKTLQDELALWHQALRWYRAQQWDTAELQLINLQQRDPGRTLYAKFLERIEHTRINPPSPEWDGATVFDTK